MILDAIIGFIMVLPKMLLNSISSFENLVIPDGVFDWFYEVFDTLTYVFPVWAILPILISSLSIKGIQIGWALLLRIKSFIPTMGA